MKTDFIESYDSSANQQDTNIHTYTIKEYKIIEYKKTNIFIIENIINDTMCNKIRAIIDRLKTQKLTFFKGNNVQCYITSNDLFNTYDDEEYYPFSTDTIIYDKLLENTKSKNIYTNKLNGVLKSEIEDINLYFNTIIKVINPLLLSINPDIIVDGVSKYIYRKIYGNTREHIDGLTDIRSPTNLHVIHNNKKNESIMIRSITFIFSLNDDYIGGELKFPYYDLSIKLKKGSVIIFPPYWTHKHSSNNLENDTYRYTVTTWGYECLNNIDKSFII
jgi:predicted 2-oxoglutarate/Fe(II)-dependent dioxygenase YbiX